MATTTEKPERAATTSKTIRSASEHAGVVAANAALAPVRHRYDEALARVERYHRILGAAVDRDGSADIAARLEARVYRDVANLDVLRLEGELLAAQQAVDAARESARTEIAKMFNPRLRDAVIRLKKALLVAREANVAVQLVQIAQHEATGQPFDGLAWMEFGVRFDQWCRPG